MRVPYEPVSVLRQIERGARGGGGFAVGLWAGRLRKRLAEAGIFTPDRVFGLAWSGAMTTARVKGLLEHLPEGVSEIYLHPATGPDFPFAAPGYRYVDELGALISSQAIDFTKNNTIRIGAFGDFVPPADGGNVGPAFVSPV